MNKYNVISLVVAGAALLLAVWAFWSKDKVAYIETSVVMEQYHGMKTAKAEFEKKSKVYQANVDTAIAEFQKELAAYEKERSGMSDKEKELKEQLLQNKQMQLGKYQEAMQNQARQEEQKLTQNVLNEVNDFMLNYGKANGYTFVFGANGSGNIVYADENSKNITKEIIEKLNAVKK